MIHRSRHEINALIAHHAFLPLFNPEDVEVCKRVVKAAYDGGVRLFECTNRSANALSIFEDLVHYISDSMPDLVIGAGTIMDEASAHAFYNAGAQFIVSPVMRPAVADYCQKNNIFWCPGSSTLTEIINAHDLGADLVKIFPANFLGGSGFVEAVRGPCPEIRVMPTGGVDGSEQSIRAWFEAGVTCIGMGSRLFTREILATKNYKLITDKSREIVHIIHTIKSRQAQ